MISQGLEEEWLADGKWFIRGEETGLYSAMAAGVNTPLPSCCCRLAVFGFRPLAAASGRDLHQEHAGSLHLHFSEARGAICCPRTVLR